MPSLSDKMITHCACGVSHSIVYSTIASRAFAWGVNLSGELGVGDEREGREVEPVEVLPPEGEKFVQVSCGNAFSVGITLPLRASREAVLSRSRFSVQNCLHTLDPVQIPSESSGLESSPSTIQYVSDSLDGAPRTARFIPTPLESGLRNHPLGANHPDCFSFNSSEVERMNSLNSNGSCH